MTRLTAWAGVQLLIATTMGAQASPPLSPFAKQKAETLLAKKYSCLGCHRLGAEGGVIAPRLDDVRTRRDAAYIAQMITDPQRTRPGAVMPRIRMPESDRTLLIRYLGGDPAAVRSPVAVAPVALPPVAAPPVAVDTNGARLYATWCASCHGATGAGNGPNAKALPVAPARHNDATRMGARADDSLYDTIDGGGAIMNRHVRMPAFGGSLTPPQIRALVRHIRTLCRCEGPAWSRS
jgi:mono/diheme cytochrome c family protein